MAAVNKIVKHNLESRTRELNESGTSLRDIADILTNESHIRISKNSVSNFLKNDIEETAKLIEKKTQLRTAVAEAEISTIEDRQKVITGLLSLAESAEHDRDRISAYKVATEALDSLDKRIGKVSQAPNSDPKSIINITQNNLSIEDKIKRYRDAGLFNAQ
jgi:predicted transcriptional regulator